MFSEEFDRAAARSDAELSEARWTAVLGRDARADGRFVYAVMSTGIFCRPSCPSRRPQRHRVCFFDSTGEALGAGFRPCRRCRPLDDGDEWTARIAAACETIARAGVAPPLASLARRAGSTPHHFLRRFKAMVGMTPREFAAARRFDEMKRQLRKQPDVTTAVFEAGYGSSSRFYERAASRLGMPPSTYRVGGRGETIRFTTAASSLGRVLVAATVRGVCAVAFGSSDAALVADLRTEFPYATLQADPTDEQGWVDRVVREIDGRGTAADLPIDVRATAFQWQVWNALRQIPWGETRTYAEVAAAIGRPNAARAVARACASNRVAVAIPCHRVLPSSGDGKTGGYRWGVERKQALLERETRPPSSASASGSGEAG
jgi:AraC family transcriptional regulator of adaptative response/methylated-DNA-[protein]-cysteine methyltransferase